MVSSVKPMMSAENIKSVNKTLGFDENDGLKEPAGSAAPLDSMIKDGPLHGINAKGLKALSLIAIDIGEFVQDGVKSAIRTRLKIGARLNDARDVFPKIGGDDNFVIWRKERAEEWGLEVAPKTLLMFMQMAFSFPVFSFFTASSMPALTA